MHFVSGNVTETVVNVQHLKVAGTAFYGTVTVNIFCLCNLVCSDIHIIVVRTVCTRIILSQLGTQLFCAQVWQSI
jgi:hypothetical protein